MYLYTFPFKIQIQTSHPYKQAYRKKNFVPYKIIITKQIDATAWQTEHILRSGKSIDYQNLPKKSIWLPKFHIY